MSCIGSFGPITLGDCGSSSKVKIETSNITKNISNSIQQSVSNVSDKSIAVQNQNVSLKGSCCKPFVVSQGLSIKQANTSKFSGDFASKTAKTMSDSINNSVDQSASQITGLLGSTVGPKLQSAIKNATLKIAQSDSFKKSIQSKMSETFGSQNQNISIDCGETIPTPPPTNAPAQEKSKLGDTGCYIDQNFVFDQVTNNLMETMMSDVMEDTQLTQVVNEAKQVMKTKSSGLEDLVSAFLGPYAMIIIAVVIGLVIFIPLIIWSLGGSKRVAEVTKAVSDTGLLQNPVQKLAKVWSRRR